MEGEAAVMINLEISLEQEIDGLGPSKMGAASGRALCASGFDEATTARFWAKVNSASPGECWPWTATAYRPVGALKRACYGMFSYRGAMIKAHRVAYALSVGPLERGQVVMHSCDNPRCCNPAHLRAGTPSENMADMAAKGRHPLAAGSDHHNAKMTEAKAVELRDAYRNGETGGALAKRFGISKSQAFNIIHGRQWRHV